MCEWGKLNPMLVAAYSASVNSILIPSGFIHRSRRHRAWQLCFHSHQREGQRQIRCFWLIWYLSKHLLCEISPSQSCPDLHVVHTWARSLWLSHVLWLSCSFILHTYIIKTSSREQDSSKNSDCTTKQNGCSVFLDNIPGIEKQEAEVLVSIVCRSVRRKAIVCHFWLISQTSCLGLNPFLLLRGGVAWIYGCRSTFQLSLRPIVCVTLRRGWWWTFLLVFLDFFAVSGLHAREGAERNRVHTWRLRKNEGKVYDHVEDTMQVFCDFGSDCDSTHTLTHMIHDESEPADL